MPTLFSLKLTSQLSKIYYVFENKAEIDLRGLFRHIKQFGKSFITNGNTTLISGCHMDNAAREENNISITEIWEMLQVLI